MALSFDINGGKILLTPTELSEILNISTRTIYNGTAKKAIKKFPIPHLRIGNLLRFHIDDVREYLERSRKV